MKRTFALAILVACFTMTGCGSDANTLVTDGADPAAVEDYKAQIEAQQKELEGIEVK